ncbi:hypothetical protein C10C_0212 [Chlamydia serpentis]|uniref:Uncharacterized protein n=1 Tax=Chlamydia serpentis TaxID=1967782 RepID=A0A2R8FAC6_9CHLA|nr:hypothetical protein [Chlamydia serpentis]SPN73390.1 hypothetical protein C10C_0212 [Chlamydia serpentis]
MSYSFDSNLAITSSIKQVRETLLFLSSKERFVRYESTVESIHSFLLEGTQPSVFFIDDLETASNLEDHELTVYFSISLKTILGRFLEKILTVSSSSFLLAADSEATLDLILFRIFGCLIFTILTVVLGPTLGVVFYCAYKIYQVTKKISFLSKNRTQVTNSLNRSDTTLNRAGTITAASASESIIKSCKAFRQSTLTFLALGLIATIALAALVVGIVFSILFVGPAAASVMTSAMIGCCAGGGGGILLSILGFLIASVYSVRKRKEAAAYMHTALLQAMVADLVMQSPHPSISSGVKQVLSKCIGRYQEFFTNEEYEELMRMSFSGLPPPPSYNSLSGLPPPPAYRSLFNEDGTPLLHSYDAFNCCHEFLRSPYTEETIPSSPPPPYS